MTKMNGDQYVFLTDREWAPEERELFYKTGEECFHEGWTDIFGILTPEGEAAITEFERSSE